ncbi:MAG: 5-(carboxyamino)imidazole ribonucleotide synthase [Pseudomonadota bacterium]
MTMTPLLPGATLGVLGGGQLGRMFALEAIRMGYRVHVFDADPHSPAGGMAHHHLRAAFDDDAALADFARHCDAVTTEFENVPAAALEALSAYCRVAPDAHALTVAQDRAREKTLFAECGVPTVRWASVRDVSDLDTAWETASGPCVLKTARLGYDGKGQAVCESREALGAAFTALGEVPCVVEQRVDLRAEVSAIVARAENGQAVVLPVGENTHRGGILHTTRVPAAQAPALTAAAADTARAIAETLGYQGVLAVEFFVTADGALLANEIAPRPHNSGHYSQLGCDVNQFELQVRALCGLPLVEPKLRQPTAMLNLLGDCWEGGTPDWAGVVGTVGTELHLYGKREARAGRKMGHVNLSAPTDAALGQCLERVCGVLGIAP